MAGVERGAPQERVLEVVVDLLEEFGYDGWALAVVAKRARVSLRDVYRFFPTRGHLIAAGLIRWMELNTFADMTAPKGADLRDGLMWCFRRLLEPWEDHPRLLEAYQRLRMDPAGRDMDDRG